MIYITIVFMRIGDEGMGWFKVNPDGSEQLEYTMEDLPVRATGGSLPAIGTMISRC